MLRKLYFSVECGKTYNVRAEKEDYTTKEVSVTVAEQTENKSRYSTRKSRM
jgi:hypothetical protein